MGSDLQELGSCGLQRSRVFSCSENRPADYGELGVELFVPILLGWLVSYGAMMTSSGKTRKLHQNFIVGVSCCHVKLLSKRKIMEEK